MTKEQKRLEELQELIGKWKEEDEKDARTPAIKALMDFGVTPEFKRLDSSEKQVWMYRQGVRDVVEYMRSHFQGRAMIGLADETLEKYTA